jgi:tRNA threonylcarbamoyladenosine biosynthesis protein TsaB
MVALILDMAGIRGKVGVFYKNQVLDQLELGEGPHTEGLIPQIQSLCAAHGILKLKELDMLITTVGPGSFTGVRIGVAVARAFKLATKKPVVGVETFPLLAFQGKDRSASSSATHLLLAIEGKRKDLYCQIFNRSTLSPVASPFSVLPQEIGLHLKRDESYWGMGDGMERLEPFLPSSLMEGLSKEHVSLQALGELGMKSFKEKPNQDIFPSYVRPPDVTLAKGV